MPVTDVPKPARSAGGYRLYSTEHLKRLTFIRRTSGRSSDGMSASDSGA